MIHVRVWLQTTRSKKLCKLLFPSSFSCYTILFLYACFLHPKYSICIAFTYVSQPKTPMVDYVLQRKVWPYMWLQDWSVYFFCAAVLKIFGVKDVPLEGFCFWISKHNNWYMYYYISIILLLLTSACWTVWRAFSLSPQDRNWTVWRASFNLKSAPR